jgi:hypothetical protein
MKSSGENNSRLPELRRLALGYFLALEGAFLAATPTMPR